ncbi:MAG: hypothetical protein QQN63_10985 [Nitrosopumilus sp.]
MTSEQEEQSSALRALSSLANGNWDKAHELVQVSSPENDWVHAHLHRVGGDLENASYWYKRAGKPVCEASLDDERQIINKALGGI